MSFTRKQRQIFKFNDGKKWRSLDPLEADIAIQAVDIDWEAKFSLLKIGDLSEVSAIVDAARKVFQLEPLILSDDGETDNGGWSSSDVMDLLRDFLGWRYEILNFTDPPQTSPPSTGGAAGATESGTDSGSISSDKLPETA